MEALELHEACLQIAAKEEGASVDAVARSQARLQKVLEAGG